MSISNQRGADIRNKIPIAIGIFGQSNELGNVLDADRTAYPQAFQSLRNAGVFTPFGPSTGSDGRGGWWCRVYDELWGAGYDAQFVQGAIGSLSFVKHAAGQVDFRSNNSTNYFAARQSAGYPDRGFYGSIISGPNNSLWRCTTGRNIAALSDGPFRVVNSQTNLDYLEYSAGSQKSGSTAPSFPATPAIGNTVADGDLVWTCVATTGFPGGSVLTEGTSKGQGHDPFGLMARLDEEMRRIRGVARKIIYIANGQSDLSASTAWYRDALLSIASYFLKRGYEVVIGLTCYNPSSGNIAAHDNLAAGVDAALASLGAGPYAARVYPGANLYRLMGTTGPMAAGGAFLNSDNVHLNGAGAVGRPVEGVHCAGHHVASSLRLALENPRNL